MIAKNTPPASISSVPSMPIQNGLILHFDINETIVIGDEAGGDTKEDCLNKILAKNAFVRIPTTDKDKKLSQIVPTEWWDGSLISSKTAPDLHTDWEWLPNCCPYYRTKLKHKAKRFTLEDDGRAYRPLYEQMEQRLNLSSTSVAVDPRISLDGVSHYILPAFFQTLYALRKRKNVHVVLRTFGSDLDGVIDAITAFCTGYHPLYPDMDRSDWILKPGFMFRGKWVRKQREKKNGCYFTDDKDDYTYELRDINSEEARAHGDEQIYDMLCNTPICAIRDDYDFWSQNHCQPHAGKPIWIDRKCSDSDDKNGKPLHFHSIFFDDNIKNDAHDSIGAVRWHGEWIYDNESKVWNEFKSLKGEDICKLQGRNFVRVPTIEPILNSNWFLEKIEDCENRLALENSNFLHPEN